MAIKSIQIFNPDPAQVSDLGGISASDIFGAPLSRIENMSGQSALNTTAEDFTSPGDDELDSYEPQEVGRPPEAQSMFNPSSPEEAVASRAESMFGGGSEDINASFSGSDLTSFVKEFEGFNAKAHGDYKQTSIGYGTRGKPGEIITRAQAEQRLSSELSGKRSHVEGFSKKYGYNFTPNEMDALTSFAFNIGSINQLTDNGRRSKEEIAAAIPLYNKAGGEELQGLKRRRAAERALFLQGYAGDGGRSVVGGDPEGAPLQQSSLGGQAPEKRSEAQIKEKAVSLALSGGGDISAAELLQGYYGNQMGSEILKAQQANNQSGLLPEEAYRSRIYDKLPVVTKNLKGARFQRFSDGNHEVQMLDADARADKRARERDAVSVVETRPESESARKVMDTVRYNSHADIYAQTEEDPSSTLEHEVGHHFTGRSPASSGLDQPLKEGSLAHTLESVASFEDTGVRNHMMKLNEATQAMGRFQRETFKATGKRLESGDFEKMVRSRKSPPKYLSAEGKRIWNYAKRLLEPTKNSKHRKNRAATLRAISEGMPSLVQKGGNARKLFSNMS